MRAWLRCLATVVWKDLLVELRTRERMSAMAAFAVLVGVLFNYAVDPTVVAPRDLAAGLVWVTLVFGGMLGMGRTFQLEEEEDALQGILLTPIPRSALYLGKVASNLVLLLVLALLVLGVFTLFFDVRMAGNPLALGGVVSLGCLGFVAVGTLFSAVSARSSMGETLLPILVFPLLVPVVIYGVTATSRLLAGRPLAEVEGNLRMLGAFAILALGSGAALFRFVVEE